MREEHACSLGFAIMLGVAETLDVLATDLNVTIGGGGTSAEPAIILYDDVSRGAGLAAQLGGA